jgi:hypothetical protein
MVVNLGGQGEITQDGFSHQDAWEQFGNVVGESCVNAADWAFPGFFRCEITTPAGVVDPWTWLRSYVGNDDYTIGQLLSAMGFEGSLPQTIALADVVGIDLSRLNEHGNGRNNGKVAFQSLELDLGSYMGPGRASDVFVVFSVWFNIGGQHWTSAQRVAGEWWMCNDRVVGRPEGEAEFLQRLATMQRKVSGIWLVRKGREDMLSR